MTFLPSAQRCGEIECVCVGEAADFADFLSVQPDNRFVIGDDVQRGAFCFCVFGNIEFATEEARFDGRIDALDRLRETKSNYSIAVRETFPIGRCSAWARSFATGIFRETFWRCRFVANRADASRRPKEWFRNRRRRCDAAMGRAVSRGD